MFASLLRDQKEFDLVDKPFVGLFLGNSWVYGPWVLRSFVRVDLGFGVS